MNKIRLFNGTIIANPEERIREYCRVEVYHGYDDCHDVSNIVTPDNIRAANRLYARVGQTVAQSMNYSLDIRTCLALVDDKELGYIGNADWNVFRDTLTELFNTFCDLKGVGIAVATKILHLKRPRLIPIVDSFVAKFLLGIDTQNVGNKKSLAGIGAECTNVVRQDINRNFEAFTRLQELISDLPIPLTVVRLYDILIWSTEKWDIRGKLDAPYGVPKAAIKPNTFTGISRSIQSRSSDVPIHNTGGTWREINTLDEFDQVIRTGYGYIVITDIADINTIHRPICRWVSRKNFQLKVTVNKCKNGHYYWTENLESAKHMWNVSECSRCV